MRCRTGRGNRRDRGRERCWPHPRRDRQSTPLRRSRRQRVRGRPEHRHDCPQAKGSVGKAQHRPRHGATRPSKGRVRCRPPPPLAPAGQAGQAEPDGARSARRRLSRLRRCRHRRCRHRHRRRSKEPSPARQAKRQGHDMSGTFGHYPSSPASFSWHGACVPPEAEGTLDASFDARAPSPAVHVAEAAVSPASQVCREPTQAPLRYAVPGSVRSDRGHRRRPVGLRAGGQRARRDLLPGPAILSRQRDAGRAHGRGPV